MLPLDNHDKIFTTQNEIDFITMSQDRPIIIDMGCGHGDYMLAHCPSNKDNFWIGIDISNKRAIKTEKRLLKARNDNFILFADDGQDVLSILPSNFVDVIHINFPDPWLKERQWKNRLFRPSFVADLVRVLKKGGELSFVTDIKEYADFVAEILTQYPQWTSVFNPVVQENLFESFPTLFYRKMSPLRPISYIKFNKQ